MKNEAMMGQPVESLPLCFFDLETTGLHVSGGHRICEVALLRVCDNVVEFRYTSLVNPQRPIEPQAAAVNGISPVMVRDAPVFATIADMLLHMINGSVLIAHNAPFDMSFLNHELRMLGYPAPLNPVLDTLVLARQLMQCQSHSLGALSSYLNLYPPDHRAMSDVLALQGLFEHLVGLMQGRGITTLGEMMRYQRGLLPGEPEPTPPPLIRLAIQEHRVLRIVYASRSTPSAHERLIQPVELATFKGQIYVRAYCHLRKDMRSFALNKIEAMELA